MRILISVLLLNTNLFAQNVARKLDSVILLHNDFNGVVLVADNGNPVFHKAFGYRNYAEKIQLNPSDIFELASVSKQFTAMVIMILKEKRKLNYDDLVEKYLSIPYKGITIRQLLTHTSGLPDYQEIMDKHWDKSKIAGNKEILQYLNKYAPPELFEPGTKYEYSNTGYVLLASIAEKASRKDFIKLCRRWIFRPLKMRSTDIRTPEQKRRTKNFAIGHIYVPEKRQYVRADSFPSSDYTIWLGNRKGPGRISSTAADLLKWDRALYSNKLVQQSTLQEAFIPARLKNDSTVNYGFGWMLRRDTALGKIVYHTGDNPGYENLIVRYIDKRKTIILLSNNAYNHLSEMMQQIEVAAFRKH
ncbi:MAG: beta-lactamase family protein [Chitinophagaceae bacterium]|nr:beta-lactamase family protein [Chitinophagaceae bacterium]